jgi:hypothetical protein
VSSSTGRFLPLPSRCFEARLAAGLELDDLGGPLRLVLGRGLDPDEMKMHLAPPLCSFARLGPDPRATHLKEGALKQTLYFMRWYSALAPRVFSVVTATSFTQCVFNFAQHLSF